VEGSTPLLEENLYGQKLGSALENLRGNLPKTGGLRMRRFLYLEKCQALSGAIEKRGLLDKKKNVLLGKKI